MSGGLSVCWLRYLLLAFSFCVFSSCSTLKRFEQGAVEGGLRAISGVPTDTMEWRRYLVAEIRGLQTEMEGIRDDYRLLRTDLSSLQHTTGDTLAKFHRELALIKKTNL